MNDGHIVSADVCSSLLTLLSTLKHQILVVNAPQQSWATFVRMPNGSMLTNFSPCILQNACKIPRGVIGGLLEQLSLKIGSRITVSMFHMKC